MQLELFLFASKNVTNIWAGIGAGMWAVSETSPADMQSRITKSKRMRVGSFGLLYCSENQSFTTPFIVYSEADPKKVVEDVWPERWRLPFRIHPLGNPTRLLHKDDAKKQWPVLQACNNITEALNITGTTVVCAFHCQPRRLGAYLEGVSSLRLPAGAVWSRYVRKRQ